MAAKKKGKKVTKAKRPSVKKARARAAKKATPKKPAKKRRAASSRKTIAAKGHASRKPASKRQRQAGTFDLRAVESRSGAQSGDLQGLRDTERADSESVDELLDEGNAFEAGIVAGVEEAEDDEEREVHTHQVPEDDVPEEYRDKDR